MVPKNLFLLLLASALTAVPVPVAQALDIVYPADQTWFTRSDYLILKGGDKPTLDGITVAINGVPSGVIDISAPDYRAAFDDFVILQPEFDGGKNTIVVEGYAGGRKVASAKAEIFLHDDPALPPPAGFERFRLHLPDREALCAPCHNMTPSKAELATADPAKNPCASCHLRMLNHKWVHGPAGVWSCTYCHPADTKPAKYQVREGDAQVCNECHADKVKEFKANKFVHGPIEAEMCSVCHDAHATDQIAQLHAPVNELCLGCHAPIGDGGHVVRGVSGSSHPLKGVPDPSNPGRELSCTGCHDPHGGKGNFLFQHGITARFALCQLCHNK